MSVVYLLRKELRAYFGSLFAYAVLSVSLALAGFFFYTDLVFFIVWGGISLPKGLWAYFFVDVRFVMLFLIPALTMGLLAEEKKLGTMELLWTYPIPELSIILAKFLAALAVFLLLLVATLLYPLLIQTVYPVEWGPVLAGYLGLFLLGAAFIAVGLFISSLTDNQVVAAMATFGVLVLFWFLTWNEAATSEVFPELLRHLSLFDRFQNFAQGAIDSQEVVFFVCVTLLFLALAWQSLQSRRWRGGGEFASLRAFFSAPSRYNWLVMAIINVGLVTLFIGVEALAIRYNRHWDLTPTKELSLSAQSRQILENLQDNVQVTAFYGERPEVYDILRDLLSQYAAESPYFHYTLLPLNRNRALAEEYGIRGYGYGKGVVELGDRWKVVNVGEASLNAAILSVMQTDQKVIYFLTGHGENNPRGYGASGYSAASRALEEENFQVKQLDLGREEEIPQDAAVIVISGPRSDLLPEEEEKLTAFIRRGGNILFMLDPVDMPVLTQLLGEYGVVLSDDVVYDPENRLLEGDPLTPRIVLYNQDHPIVQNFTAYTLFSRARSVDTQTNGQTRDFIVTPFAQTGPGSWARLGDKEVRADAVDMEDFKARPGPIPVAAAVTVKLDAGARPEDGKQGGLDQAAPEARLVVYGDSDFANNYFFNVLGNRDFFLNTVHWLAEEEEFIATRPPKEETALPFSPLLLTARQSRLIFWTVGILQPAFILLVGIIVSWRKKRRG